VLTARTLPAAPPAAPQEPGGGVAVSYPPAVARGRPSRTRTTKRRDRHGRGLRGPLLPSSLPAARTRAERFDDLVLDAVDLLERRWAQELAGVEFAVEDVPPSDPAPWEDDAVPLGRLFPADGASPARVVVYRRPVETRADEEDLDDLVAEVVIQQVAHLLELPPDDVDPRYPEE